MRDLYRLLIESSLTGVYLVAEGRLAYVNAALAAMFGYTVDELAGREFVATLVAPADRPVVTRNVEARPASGAEAVRYRFRGLRKDGSAFPVEAHGRWISHAGKDVVVGALVDDSDRVSAETALRDRQTLLEKAERMAHVGWWENDLVSGRYLLSDEVRRAVGLGPDEMPRWDPERWLALMHPEDRPRVSDAIAAVNAGAPPRPHEYRVVHPDGTIRIVQSHGVPEIDEKGRILRWFGALQDITELREAERGLRASEERFRIFVDHAADAFFVLDRKRTILDVNARACDDLGYTRAELIGRDVREIDVGIDEADFEHLRRRLANGESVNFETRYRRKDGTVFPAELRLRRFEQDGEKTMATVRDITDRKRAAERVAAQRAVARVLAESSTIEEAVPRVLQAVCEHLGWVVGAFWSIDPEADVLHLTEVWSAPSVRTTNFERAIRATRFERGSGLPGRVWATRTPEIVSPLPYRETRPTWAAARAEGLRAGIASPVMLGGEVLGVVVFFRHELRTADRNAIDIMATIGSQIGQFIERRRAERSLRLVQAELEHLTRVMTMNALTASIAHEIKQPIAATVANAAAARRWLSAAPPNVAEARAAIDRITADGMRGGAVLDGIRDRVKKTPIRKEKFDLNDAVLEVIELTRSEALKHQVTVQTDLAATLPPVNADRVQIQQVVLNLTINAFEAMSSVNDGPRVATIGTRNDMRGAVVATVRDSGPGFAPGIREHLFEMFNTTKPSGLGFGLAICRSIVEAHGGRLWAHPVEPRGVEFEFTVPCDG